MSKITNEAPITSQMQREGQLAHSRHTARSPSGVKGHPIGLDMSPGPGASKICNTRPVYNE
jgi:hypothetical protein